MIVDDGSFFVRSVEEGVLRTIIADMCVPKSSVNNRRSLEVNKSSLNQQADGACS
jgi:hypothetical protein